MTSEEAGPGSARSEARGDAEWTVRLFRETDVPGIVALINAADAVDRHDEGTSEEELLVRFRSPRSHPDRQVLVAEGTAPGVSEGMFLGYGRINYNDNPLDGTRIYYLRVVAHPGARPFGLEDTLGSKLVCMVSDETAGEQARQPDKVRLCAYVHEGDSTTATWRSLGFQEVRRFWTMERPLNEPIEEPPLIDGILFRNYRRPEDNESTLRAFNASFADHYDFHPEPEDDWNYWMSVEDFRPDLSWLAEVAGSDGHLAGLSLSAIYERDNARTGRREGWIDILGTVREWRRKGVGKGLLLHGLRSFKDAGLDTALLGVDSESLTGADRLYRSVGFRVRYSELQFEAQLDQVTSSAR